MAASCLARLFEEEEEEENEMEDLLSLALLKSNRDVAERRWWVHPINDKREQEGCYYRLIKELELHPEKYIGYFRLSKEQFEEVLYQIEDVIVHEDTRMRKSIPARERLSVTLRYLATGESFKSLSYSYRLGISTIALIVREVCAAIWDTLQPKYMKAPTTEDEWKRIAHDFESTWQFPNCCGAIDGKHIVMKSPSNSGSIFYNYKGTFSIILLAVVDANYKFVIIDIGSCGMNNDSGVFRASNFGQSLKKETLGIPADRVLPGAEELGPLPYVFIADEGLPLLKNVMRPYSGRGRTEEERIFNYRLSRARRIVESTFGILSCRWRVFHTKILVEPETATLIVKAACVLHNYCQNTSTPAQQSMVVENSAPDEVYWSRLQRHGRRNPREAESIRDNYRQYFNNQGEVSWQYDLVRRGMFST